MSPLLKVVYLDDESELCELFRDLFSSPEVQITTFTDPLKAIQAVRLDPPDLFFVDFRLPGMTGVEVAKQVDAGEKVDGIERTVKVMITGELSVPLEAPFAAVFYKPFPISEVSELLQKRLKSKAQ